MSVAQLEVLLSTGRCRRAPMRSAPSSAPILINNHAFYRVIGTIDTEDFFKDAHRTIFATMRRMAEQQPEIDPLTLKEELAKHAQLEQVGGVGLRLLARSTSFPTSPTSSATPQHRQREVDAAPPDRDGQQRHARRARRAERAGRRAQHRREVALRDRRRLDRERLRRARPDHARRT